jgi:hypothetical protein
MTELTDLSETDGSNTTITGTSIAEGCPPSNINNGMRATLGLIRRAFKASIFRVRDTADQTKLLAFDLSGLTTATTRTVTMGDADVTLRPQAWELIETKTASASASLSWTGLSAYRVIRLTGTVRPSINAATAYARVSTDNGGSYSAAAYNYQISRIGGGTSAPIGGTTVGMLIAGTTAIGSSANMYSSFQIILEQFNKPTILPYHGTAVATTDTGSILSASIGGTWGSSTPRDAIQIIMDSGNITDGYVTLEGIRG